MLSLKEGDTVVVMCEQVLTGEQRGYVNEWTKRTFPDGVKVAVLDAGMKIAAVTKSNVPIIPQPEPSR